MIVDTEKENICVNKIVQEKTENAVIEGDSIVPDVKPDVISVIKTCGNICIYKKVSDEVIETACKDSGLEDFLKEVSLDYVVGQNGAMLSGGQKQKIALARALVHDKPIIIFDEVTSNTDVYSEHQINGLLHTRLKEKTVIIITHKQEILQDVDQIVMLKDGAVVGTGKYDDLVINNAEFKDMLRGLKKMD